MATVYILKSESLSRFYIGSCENFKGRLIDHLTQKYQNSFTAKVTDWKVFLEIGNLEYGQARRIEAHIKRMKSKKYIENLLRYDEMRAKLKDRFSSREN